MHAHHFIFFYLLFPLALLGQDQAKPTGCFAGTNGTNSNVLSHPEARGVLLVEKWSALEEEPDVYNFAQLNDKINTVTAAGKKYALAIAGGAFGSPAWLIDSLQVEHHNFQYQGKSWQLPLWWNAICQQKLHDLIQQLAYHYAADTMLSHVYVTQMTVNGIEGHLNGVNMDDFRADGFTNQKWIEAANATTQAFATAFAKQPIVFELHEIDRDTLVPAQIMAGFANTPNLQDRVGLGMWWLSGKTNYQTNLIEYISNFTGDKYAQIIGRSDQPERFQDNAYASVFTQAKQLNIRYIEPWPYEFQHHTHDSLIRDFNQWADAKFTPDGNISLGLHTQEHMLHQKISIYPNPTHELLTLVLDLPYKSAVAQLFNLKGKCLLTCNEPSTINISQFPTGVYTLKLQVDNKIIYKKIVKTE